MEIRICAAPGCENEFEVTSHNKKYCSITCKRRAARGYASDEEEIDLVTLASSFEAEEEGIQELHLQRMEFLRKENSRLHNLSEKHKHIAEEIWNTIFNTVISHAQQISVAPPKNILSKSYQREIVFNPSNSDTQLGKRTPTYNSDIAAERVELYTDKILEMKQDFGSIYPIRKCHVWFLGDIVEGEGIFPTQPHVIDSSLYEQVAKNGPSIYGTQIRRLLEEFEEVHVVGVIGNHGSIGKFNNPETNMDRMLYKILEHMFHYEPRVTFNIPDGYGESMFYAVDTIGAYSTLLVHGDQFPTPTSQHQYWKKILGWKTSGIETPFDDVIMGHWHQNAKLTIGNTVARIAGSTESHNTFAQERIGVMGRPSQHMQMIDPYKGVVFEADVFLD